jgi:hypothetical protein
MKGSKASSSYLIAAAPTTVDARVQSAKDVRSVLDHSSIERAEETVSSLLVNNAFLYSSAKLAHHVLQAQY